MNNVAYRLFHRIGQILTQLADDHPGPGNNFSLVRLYLVHDKFERRRLAGAVAPDQADPFARLDRKFSVTQDDLLAKIQPDIFEAKQRHEGFPWTKRCILLRIAGKTQGMCMSEDRFIDLESRLAHQDQLLNELNDVVTGQQAKIMQLEELCKALIQRVRSVGEKMSEDDAGDERPPHY